MFYTIQAQSKQFTNFNTCSLGVLYIYIKKEQNTNLIFYTTINYRETLFAKIDSYKKTDK